MAPIPTGRKLSGL